VKHFEAPQTMLAGLDATATATLLFAASDVALIVDAQGVIRDMAVGADDIDEDQYADWVGRPWAETVTAESRPKVANLLDQAARADARKWRHINHSSGRGSELPMLYSAIRYGDQGRVVAFGRDLREASQMQQRLIEAQQSLERDYLRLRHMETRYRHLFHKVGEAMLIVDAQTLKVTEMNPAAERLLGAQAAGVLGATINACFAEAARDRVAALLGGVRLSGRAEELKARLQGPPPLEVLVSASLFRQTDGSSLLLQLAPIGAGPQLASPSSGSDAVLLEVVERVPDGFVVTDLLGKVLVANNAFVEMTQLAAREQVIGQNLSRWLGRSEVDLSVLLSNLKQHGSLRLFATTVRGQYGVTSDVEISAASVPAAEHPCLGFTVRDVGRRLSNDSLKRRELPRSASQLIELVGRVPLKDIVGETTDLIEQMCIEAALELTRDNRASASEMLGLSRQSLYVKLRRYGLGDLGADSDKQ
jgi:transcriptional regulator PpsR